LIVYESDAVPTFTGFLILLIPIVKFPPAARPDGKIPETKIVFENNWTDEGVTETVLTLTDVSVSREEPAQLI